MGEWPSYKNVPAEKRRRIPVRQCAPVSSVDPEPTRCTNKKVATAPTGAAKLKMSKCVLAARLERPCLRRIDVSPNEAGALWTIIARKMIKLRPVSEVDAPRAIPSAAA